MTRPPRPVPIDMKVADLGADTLIVTCPKCQRSRQMNDRYLERRYPAGTLLVRVVARHYCRSCSRPGAVVRGIGEIQPYPRSGARHGPNIEAE